MDQDTRNALQRATQKIRQILEDEFAEQLEGTFDILIDGTILPEPGKHLDATQQLTRHKLVDAIEHIKANGKTPVEAVNEYKREAAFTFLNRFVALRMLETRRLLQECVSKGGQSGGFKEFCGLSPGLSALSDGGYRLYLECLCDELTVEVKILFDRRDSSSLLWPRRGALGQVLDILAQAELATVWLEDETIGWVYQYFNSSEERKRMREESQAPRTSHELAVRNQFFTPRYVVEFLVQNTLGRIWYEMREGHTRLESECSYLVARPNERFLSERQDLPILNQVEFPSHRDERTKGDNVVPYRRKVDPRDLRVLDPACGSGHFLIHAFDLLVLMYEEAWHDAECPPPNEGTGPDGKSLAKRLNEDYSSLTELHAALPGLILARNLHGIDIDPRATQIASLALWMRSQRAFDNLNVPRDKRLPISRSNVVCAEPMPGEHALVDEFLEAHFSGDAEGELLASLVRRVFETMKLAGHAGSLLKIEEAIADVVAQAKQRWLDRHKQTQTRLFVDGPTLVQQELSLATAISDESFWEEAEQRIYAALQLFAQQSQSSVAFSRKLFAEDTARGFDFVEVARQKFDVILMNPPFGEPSVPSVKYLSEEYAKERNEIIACFLSRSHGLLKQGGRIGCLSSRTVFFNKDTQSARELVMFDGGTFAVGADLGWKVLDGAVVEAAAYVTERSHRLDEAIMIRALRDTDKEAALRSRIDSVGSVDEVFDVPVSRLSKIPGKPLAYWIPRTFLTAWQSAHSFSDQSVQALKGLSSADNFRFLRLYWEVECANIDVSGRNACEWVPMVKGGEYNPFYDDVHLLLQWADGGTQLKNFPQAAIRNADHYFQPGGTYPYRTTSGFCVRILPKGCAFSDGGYGLLVDGLSTAEMLRLIAYCHTRPFRASLEIFLGEGDSTASESAARNYVSRAVDAAPLLNDLSVINEETVVAWAAHMMADFELDETSRIYRGFPAYFPEKLTDFRHAQMTLARESERGAVELLERVADVERAVEKSLALDDETRAFLDDEFGPNVCDFNLEGTFNLDRVRSLYSMYKDDLTRSAMEEAGNRRYTSKKMYYVSRRIELLCRIFSCSPRQILSALEEAGAVNEDEVRDFARRGVSWAIGYAFGRWGLPKANKKQRPSPDSFFQSLPHTPPAALIEINGAAFTILADDANVAHDIIRNIKTSFAAAWPSAHSGLLRNATSILNSSGEDDTYLRDWLRRNFFDEHLMEYTKSRRKAPIYWQLATPSTSYSVWLYYHRFTKDTFFKVLNEYVKPKLEHERQKLDRLRGEAGAEPTRSQRKDIEGQEKFVAELASMVEEVERIAPLWNPNLNDGVIINFAPLWRLVPQNKSWQKECKQVWDKLVAGDYDWARLAMHLWPERVVPKCVTDASLAIAHGLEETFWTQDDRDRFQPLEAPTGGWQPIIDKLVAERSSPAVKAALQSLLDAPSLAATPSRRRNGRRG